MILLEFKSILNHFGFIIPENAEFYLEEGRIGMKVGEYVHSCHVDTSDIIILLHINEEGKTELKEYWGPWFHKIA